MFATKALRVARLNYAVPCPAAKCTRPLTRALTTSRPLRTASQKNVAYDFVRDADSLQSLVTATNTTGGRTLVTLWKAPWCATCEAVAPLIRQVVVDEGAGEDLGGVAYVEVVLDAQSLGDLGMAYTVTTLPTLLAFSRSLPRYDSRVTRKDQLMDKAFLRRWIEEQAQHGHGSREGLFGLFK